MCAVGKNNGLIKLPLKVVLTENGATEFMRQKKKLQRFKLADNNEEYGIEFTVFNPRSLQQMFMLDYVSKMQISMSEFASKRQELMDLSKILIYSALYRQFDREALEKILATDCIRNWNRANAASLIDEKNRPQDSFLRLKLLGNDAIISYAREKILQPMWEKIVHDPNLSTEEKNVHILMSEKYVNHMSLFTWYILVKFFKSEEFDEIVSCIRSKLNEYMEKSCLAEYISLMIMELAQNSENENVKKLARTLYRGIEDIDSLIFDPEIRKKIVKELEKRGELVFISWKLGGGSLSIGKAGKLQITLYNKGDKFKEFKENVEEKKSANLSKRSLVDFYNNNPDAMGDSSMGLYYLSYLDEACKKVNVKFESIVNQFTSSDLTVINLVFYF
ncbi:MAG: hypothetical protein ACTTHG_04920 [Treponemataceae bacterium]